MTVGFYKICNTKYFVQFWKETDFETVELDNYDFILRKVEQSKNGKIF